MTGSSYGLEALRMFKAYVENPREMHEAVGPGQVNINTQAFIAFATMSGLPITSIEALTQLDLKESIRSIDGQELPEDEQLLLDVAAGSINTGHFTRYYEIPKFSHSSSLMGLAVRIRASSIYVLYPLLFILDLVLLSNLGKKRSSEAVNAAITLFCGKVMPTPASKLALSRYKSSNFIKRLDFEFGKNQKSILPMSSLIWYAFFRTDSKKD